MASKIAPKRKLPKHATKRKPLDVPAADVDNDGVVTDTDLQIKMLNDRIRRLESEKRQAMAKESLLINTIKEVFESDPPMTLYNMPPKPKLSSKHENEEVAVVFLSDIHYGKTTPTFNSAVCEQRLMVLAEKVSRITQLRRNQANIKELHVLMGGDMLEGETIFSTQAHSIDNNLLEQACRSGPSAYLRMLQKFLAEFEKVKIVCVPGNHGRNGNKHTHNHPLTNWDRVLYEILRSALLGRGVFPRQDLSDRLEFVHEDQFYAIDRIGDWGILLVHGDQIRGGHAGFPFYGVGKKAWGWNDALQDYDGIPESWDYLCFGHFHTLGFSELNLKQWFANGSIESHNTFAQEQLAQSGVAAQWLFYFDPKRGLINQNVLYMEPHCSDLIRAHRKAEKFLGKTNRLS